jgi:hypothetical protein
VPGPAGNVPVRPPRLIHRDGLTYRATFEGATIVPWLADVPLFAGQTYDAIVRFSRFGNPLPLPLPDVVAIAIKIKKACGPNQGDDQDLTFFSATRWRRLRALPAPRRHAGGAVFSTSMSYRIDPAGGSPGATRVRFGVHLGPVAPMRGIASAFPELVAAIGDDFSLNLLTAVGSGRWWQAGSLHDFRPDVPWGEVIRYRPGNTSELQLTVFGRWRDGLYRWLQGRGP